MRPMILPLAFALALPALPALAADPLVYAGAALSFSAGDGADSSTRQDLNGYIEGELSGFYAGISADIYNGSENNEIDPYIGYRSETAGGLSYDVVYTRYFYPNAGGDCCGALTVTLGKSLTDALSASLETNYYPEDKLADAQVTFDYGLTDKVTLSAAFGLAEQDVGGASQSWELTAAYQLGEQTAVSATYYDGKDADPYIGLDLTWDVTLLGG